MNLKSSAVWLATAATMAALAVAAPAQAAVNLVVNGGFETRAAGTPVQGFQVGTAHRYGQALTGWTSTLGSNTNTNGAFNVLFNSATATTVSPDTLYNRFESQTLARANYGGASPDGGYFMALDGDISANGYLRQTITGLTIGREYELRFLWAGTQYQNRVGDTTIRLNVDFGSDNFATTTLINTTHGFQGWFEVVRRFTARSNNQTLSFLAEGTPNGLPPVALLDGISISAVPEPQSWAMLIAGFALVGVTARRRRAVAA